MNRRRCTPPGRYLYDRRCRRVRVLARRGSRAVTYRVRLPALVVLLALTAAAIVTGTITGHIGTAAITVAALTSAWAAYTLRIHRITPVGPDSGPPPGGAGVREPRRPLPKTSGGASVFPLDDGPPKSAVASA